MRHDRSPLLAFCLASLAGAAVAQGPTDVLYYKFDETGGRRVVNYASGSGVAPAEGMLTGSYATTHVPGTFGPSAMSGGTATNATSSNYTDTGWIPTVSNSSITIAFFMKQRTAPPSTSYLFTANSGLCRMFTGGVASRGLRLASWGGTPANLDTAYDVQTAAASNWLHVAIVIDATAMTATYYFDGVAQPSVTTNGGITLATGTATFHIGGYTSYGGLYDIDEFRLSLRAASAAEIVSWAKASSAASGPYGKGCNGGSLAGSGLPSLGNATHALVVGGTLGNVFALGLGTSRLAAGSLTLPLDLGVVFPSLSGCNWESSAELVLGGALGGTTTNVPVPVPMNASLAGFTIWCQALTFTGVSNVQSTNGFALGLGQ